MGTALPAHVGTRPRPGGLCELGLGALCRCAHRDFCPNRVIAIHTLQCFQQSLWFQVRRASTLCLTEHSCGTQTGRVSSQGGQPARPPSFFVSIQSLTMSPRLALNLSSCCLSLRSPWDYTCVPLTLLPEFLRGSWASGLLTLCTTLVCGADPKPQAKDDWELSPW